MFYVDIQNDAEYVIYYNMTTVLNESIVEATQGVIRNRPITDEAWYVINTYQGGEFKEGRAQDYFGKYGVMGSYDPSTGHIDYELVKEMAGITAVVNKEIAERVLERAIYYCPKDTGFLASTGRIEEMPDGKCRIYFDCRYAWYVHEFTWVEHKYPTCAKFLTLAIQEVESSLGV